VTPGAAPNGYGLGVDLGTTHTAAAVRADGRLEVVRLGAHRHEIPSLVYARADGEVLVGDAAERRGLSEPERLAREFKRRVGDQVKISLGGTEYSAPALMALLLRDVVETVTHRQESVPDAVTVTHPANWTAFKRDRLAEAFRAAGLDDISFRTEPEAIAVQYAAGERIRPDEIVAVYDLGGGTFDAAVLRKTTTGFEVLGEPKGVEDLGGSDFDEEVYAHVAAALDGAIDRLDPDDEGVVQALARLRLDCMDAKESLSLDTDVMIPVALPGLHTRVRLNRSEFEARIAARLDETVDAMRSALRSAATAPAELKCVLLAGGSAHIPLVGQRLTAAFDRPTVRDPHPEHSVALGAALLTEAHSAHPTPTRSDTEAVPRISGSAPVTAPIPPTAPIPVADVSVTSTAGRAEAPVIGRATVPEIEKTRTIPVVAVPEIEKTRTAPVVAVPEIEKTRTAPIVIVPEVAVGDGGRHDWWREAMRRLRAAAAGLSLRSRRLIPLITALAVLAVVGGLHFLQDRNRGDPADHTTGSRSATPTSASPSPSNGDEPSGGQTSQRNPGSTRTTTRRAQPKLVMPSVEAMSTADAKKVIADVGFTRTPRIREETNDTVAAGTVIKTDPPAGERCAKDTRITLTVSVPTPAEPAPEPIPVPGSAPVEQ
jgi:molecular chaperone DnaK (HSP70)